MISKKLVIGLIAHVDAGKTTLSEALLYQSKAINSLGRVDHQNSVLDNDELERKKGITIYAKEARFNIGEIEFILLDTPGHADLSFEMERVLPTLDYAILLIDASKGVKAYTKRLFTMLEMYKIPTFIFMNKIDIFDNDGCKLLMDVKNNLSNKIVDMTGSNYLEDIAMLEDNLLDKYLNSANLSDQELKKAFNEGVFIPLFFGSALKNLGIKDLLSWVEKLTTFKEYSDDFKAYIYRISYDNKKQMLVSLKIFGGKLLLKTSLDNEKIDELRLYSGSKFKNVDEVLAGDLVTVKGLSRVIAGEWINAENPFEKPVTPYLNNEIVAINTDYSKLLSALKVLEKSNPFLNVKEYNKHISIAVMGDVQKEVLLYNLAQEGIQAEIKEARITYKETIEKNSYGIGHFEPLHHYAEVHVRLRPLNRGRGIVFANPLKLKDPFLDVLENYLKEEVIKGVLTASALDDVEISVVAIKTSQKHTSNEDVKKAFSYAIRNALIENDSILLEPFEQIRLEVDNNLIADIIFLIEKYQGQYNLTYFDDKTIVQAELASIYVAEIVESEIVKQHHILVEHQFSAYAKVNNSEAILKEYAYNPFEDIDAPCGSIFFKNGAGYHVSIEETFDLAHTKPLLEKSGEETFSYNQIKIDEAELKRVFSRSNPSGNKEYISKKKANCNYRSKELKKEKLMLVDGYNMLYAMNEKADIHLDVDALINELSYYHGAKNIKMWIVFDAYNVDNPSSKGDDFRIIYTNKNESADVHIQKLARELQDKYDITVVSSDHLIQVSIFGSGAYRMSSRNLLARIEKMKADALGKY